MPTNYPTGLDSFTNPIATNLLSSPSHSAQHDNENDAIVALETYVGITGSASSSTLTYKLTSSSSVDPGHKHSTSSLSGQVAVAQGGTGAATFTAGLLKASGTAAFTTVAAPSGAVVGDIDTQTLTNKTISGASNTLTVREADFSFTDIATANVSTTKHGLAPKLPNVVTQYLDGTGNYSVPPTSVTAKGATATRAGTTASGTQTIAHNLGKTPTYITFNAKQQIGASSYLLSDGSYDGTNNKCAFVGADASSSGTDTNCIHVASNSGNDSQTATVTALDATNITLTWVKAGSGSGASANNIQLMITSIA